MSEDIISPINVSLNKYYDVPCVKTDTGNIIPVLLPAHTDGNDNCLDELQEHYHIDFRFIDYNTRNKYTAFFKKNVSDVFISQHKAIRKSFNSIEIGNESVFFFINRWYNNKINSCLENNKCPHNGVQIVNRCGTCPAHGIKWNLKTGKLRDFKLPFYLELANKCKSKEDNPRGKMEDLSCEIFMNKKFEHDGCVIMVDSNGKRYGKMVQHIDPREYKVFDIIKFNTNNICN